MITQITKMIIQPSLAFRRDPAEVINEGGTAIRNYFSDVLLLNQCNQKLNQCNQKYNDK